MAGATVAERVAAVRARVRDVCRAAGRDPAGVRLIAVSKTRPAADIEAAAAAGIRDFGENRVQEAAAKLPAVRAPIVPHLVGRLQRNKVRAALRHFAWIHSVDSAALATRIARIVEAGEATAPAPIPVLVQVDLAGEATKTGVPAADLAGALAAMAPLSGIRVRGLMAIPPLARDPEEARPFFAALRDLGQRFAGAGLPAKGAELSMGMSHDYAVAIAEGATMVRIGTAIFGPRAPAGPAAPISGRG